MKSFLGENLILEKKKILGGGMYVVLPLLTCCWQLSKSNDIATRNKKCN